MLRVSVSSLAAVSMTALILAGCGGGDRAAPAARSAPQFAYYDSQGRLVYRGGPLYDSNGAPLDPVDPRQVAAPSPSAPPVVTPIVAPQNPTAQPRLQFTQPEPQIQVQNAPQSQARQPQIPQPQASQPLRQAQTPPAPQPSRSFPQAPGGPRFDANGNLIPVNDGVVAPEFDAAGNLVQPGAAPALAPAPAPAFVPPAPAQTAPMQTAAVQAAPAAPNFNQAPSALGRQSAAAAAPRPHSAPTARISGDPRATAAFDVSGTSWIVKAIGGRPVRGGMTLYFVVAGDQRMAIVESVCDQEIGAFEGGRGGSVVISGLVGCAADRGLTGALNSARRFAISADKQRMQLIDETGAPIAELTNLVSA